MGDDRFIFLNILPHRHKPTHKLPVSLSFDLSYIIIFDPITVLYSYYSYYADIIDC